MSTANIHRNRAFIPMEFHQNTGLPTSAVQVRFELNKKFTQFSTDQRALAVLVLWGHDGTEDVDQVRLTVNLLVARLGGDDHCGSVRFAIALEFTFDFIDDLGLDARHRDELSGALNTANRDYASTGKEVCKIVEESRTSSKVVAADVAAEAAPEATPADAASLPAHVPYFTPPSVHFSNPQKPVASPVTMQAQNKPSSQPDLESSASKSDSELKVRKSVKSRLSRKLEGARDKLHSAADALSHRVSNDGRLVQEKTESRTRSPEAEVLSAVAQGPQEPTISEYPAPSVGRRAKNAVSNASAHIRDGFAAARESLSEKFRKPVEAIDIGAKTPVIEEEDDGYLPSEEFRDCSALEPRTPTVGERMRDTLSEAAQKARERAASARSALSGSGRQVWSSVRAEVSSMKQYLQVSAQRAGEMFSDGLEAANNARNGKTVARMKASIGQAAERSQRFAGSLAKGVSSGAQVAGGLLSKTAGWVRARRAEAQGFERM